MFDDFLQLLAKVVYFLETYAGDPNNLSIVLMISFGEADILLTGDATAFVEELLIERGVLLRADVLKVPHNGSARASTPEFLEEVGPACAIAVGLAMRKAGE